MKSAEVVVVLDGEVQKCQNCACDLGPENEVKVQGSRYFNWPYLRHLLSQNQNVCCSGCALPWALTIVNHVSQLDLLSLTCEKCRNYINWHILVSFWRYSCAVLTFGYSLKGNKLKFNVKYWPKFGTWEKFNGNDWPWCGGRSWRWKSNNVKVVPVKLTLTQKWGQNPEDTKFQLAPQRFTWHHHHSVGLSNHVTELRSTMVNYCYWSTVVNA